MVGRVNRRLRKTKLNKSNPLDSRKAKKVMKAFNEDPEPGRRLIKSLLGEAEIPTSQEAVDEIMDQYLDSD
jgi:hypothetical protein